MTDQHQRLKVFQAGATDYLVKPFVKEELLSRLRVHLERSLLIRQLRSTIEELNQAEHERTEKQRLQGVVELAGAVCHELNQPIQTISGFAELIMMKASEDDPFITYIHKIKQQTDRMGKITGRLMRVTAYRTKPHDALTRIIDIEEASGELAKKH
jgi:signal transduction histidine kinase